MRRCWETAGRLIWKCPAIVLTERSASTRRSSIRRRAGWLIAPKTSGSRLGVTTMLPIYVSKHLLVNSELGLCRLWTRGSIKYPRMTHRQELGDHHKGTKNIKKGRNAMHHKLPSWSFSFLC